MKDLSSEIKNLLKGKVVILGVGNSLKSDDGAGTLIAKDLAGKVSAIVIDGGETPENQTGVIRKEKPDVVLMIDAVDFKGTSGEVRLIKKEEISNLGLTTHNMSLGLFIDFVENEMGTKIFILGIQPKSTIFGEVISEDVSSAISNVKKMLIDLLGEKVNA